MRDPSFGAPTLASTIVTVLVALIVFGFVLQVSLVGVLRETDPVMAMRIAPYDSEAAAAAATKAILADQSPATLARVQSLAIRSIQRDPTSVAALRTLGMAREFQGKPDQALRLMKQSEGYSRRDMLTQLWFIEHFSQKGMIQETLRHYDIAMRGSTRAKNLLIPNLVSAASDLQLQGPIRALFAPKPKEWWQEFSNTLISTGDLVSAVNITRGLLDPRVPEERALLQNLLVRLTAANRPDLAWLAYTGGRLRADPKWTAAAVRSPGFESVDALPLFDWQFAEDADLGAARAQRPSGTGFALELTAREDRSGDVAFQMLHLSPGRYSLRYSAGGPQVDLAPLISVSVGCTTGKGGVLVAAKPGSGRAAVVAVAGKFLVPADCPWQWLTVRANAWQQELDGAVWIDDIDIRRSGE